MILIETHRPPPVQSYIKRLNVGVIQLVLGSNLQHSLYGPLFCGSLLITRLQARLRALARLGPVVALNNLVLALPGNQICWKCDIILGHCKWNSIFLSLEFGLNMKHC